MAETVVLSPAALGISHSQFYTRATGECSCYQQDIQVRSATYSCLYSAIFFERRVVISCHLFALARHESFRCAQSGHSMRLTASRCLFPPPALRERRHRRQQAQGRPKTPSCDRRHILYWRRRANHLNWTVICREGRVKGSALGI